MSWFMKRSRRALAETIYETPEMCRECSKEMGVVHVAFPNDDGSTRKVFWLCRDCLDRLRRSSLRN